MEKTHPCPVCGTPDHRKPMCFKGEPWCCERHRKLIVGELSPNAMEFLQMQRMKAKQPT